jgi:hypothetical protein
MAVLKVGKTVFKDALLVSVASKAPYTEPARQIASAPTGISKFLPGFRRDNPKVHTATPLERAIMRNA